mmetsp:Transcript_28426/g.68320  ORF Transcript_28426/g.68320 Transcript_28426/m.68320 type:complete len:268 (+) Transcript_28426:30-833(+)
MSGSACHALHLASRFAAREDLLSARVVNRASLRVPWTAALFTVCAAALTVDLADRQLRRLFNIIEGEVCHHRSPWRRGFILGGFSSAEAVYWTRRAGERFSQARAPPEIGFLLRQFLDDSDQMALRIDDRPAMRLQALMFHWHRLVAAGPLGALRAVQRARACVRWAGAPMLECRQELRLRSAVDVKTRSKNVTEEALRGADVVYHACTILDDLLDVMNMHPNAFGLDLITAKEDDDMLKEEAADMDERLARRVRAGFWGATEQVMV